MKDNGREIKDILKYLEEKGFIFENEGLNKEGFNYFIIKNKTNGRFLVEEIN